MMPRVLGIDIGTVRVGLAVSDPTGSIAQPLDVIARADAVDDIVRLTRELQVEEIVVGIPLRMDGAAGPEAREAETFADEIAHRTGLRVSRFDERLSTVEAGRAMRSAGSSSRHQRGRVDKVAAAVVLQAFLDSRR